MHTHSCALPVTLLNWLGSQIVELLKTPTVPICQLPAMFGLTAARHIMIKIEIALIALRVAGSGDNDIARALLPGSQQFEGVLALAGHVGLPLAEFLQGLGGRQRGRLQVRQQLPLPATAQ